MDVINGSFTDSYNGPQPSGSTGWARFSHDRKHRYRLGYALTPRGVDWIAYQVPEIRRMMARAGLPAALIRVVFVMLNPSTADAFKLDPTVRRCRDFAIRWGADVLEVVNLFSLRSPNPQDLYRDPPAGRGDDVLNNEQIIDACSNGAQRVIAAWGTHGALSGRGHDVANRLVVAGVRLEHLGLTTDGYPKHPLARGKHRIPDHQEPAPFVRAA